MKLKIVGVIAGVCLARGLDFVCRGDGDVAAGLVLWAYAAVLLAMPARLFGGPR